MRSFDILHPETPLFGQKLLEASAGTGKTFVIEHLVIRLLLEESEGEAPLAIEQILAITFTKAAAREMRMRIRSNLEQALLALQKGSSTWPYLQPYLASKEAKRRLEDAKLGFENAQIFTIHSFCQRMLTEFALEARVLQPSSDTEPLGRAIQTHLLNFLETQEVLCPEQLRLLLGKRSFSTLYRDLLKAVPHWKDEGSFCKDRLALLEHLRNGPKGPVDEKFLLEEFKRIEPLYKRTGFSIEELHRQVFYLAQLFNDLESDLACRRLIESQAALFRFLSYENRKKGKEPSLNQIFAWSLDHLYPILQNAADPKRLLARLRAAWSPLFKNFLEEKGLFSPDFLLERMRCALDYPEFILAVRNRYKAVVIDEFQDTDTAQWEIFSRLFGGVSRLFYLVGDPKQSIYRFRNADLYTYYRARDSFGADAHYSLDTNYRSVPELVSALNDFFSVEQVHPWLFLPKENKTEMYRPVKSGVEESWDPGDGKKALQFFQIKEIGEQAHAYIAGQIALLRPYFDSLSSFAILVRSWEGAYAIQSYLQKQSIPSLAKSRESLGKSPALQAFKELFDVLFFPRNTSAVRVFLTGPFVNAPCEELLKDTFDLPWLYEWKALLESKGLPAFFRRFLAMCWKEGEPTIYEKIAARGSQFFRDAFQVLEQLLLLRYPNFETIQRFFLDLREADPDEQESGRKRMDVEENAVHIMTQHASKGLEFDIVFALGVAEKTPLSDDEPYEIEAEKLRQLYVALTRAKKRVYLPLLETASKAGAEAPLELLWRRSKLGSEPLSIVEKLAKKNPHVAIDKDAISLCSRLDIKAEERILQPPAPFYVKYRPGSIFSYSALVKNEAASFLEPLSQEEKTLHTLPRGAETGVLFHKIFERIFKEESPIREIVREEMHFSTLTEWEPLIFDVVKKSLAMPFLDVERSKVQSEIEFLFQESPHFFKGFIDLVFLRKEKLYFLDWKTNWLGQNEENYSEKSLHRAMEEHNYWLQASLYAEALQRSWPNVQVGGAYYFFLRGIDAPGQGLLFFQPKAFTFPL